MTRGRRAGATKLRPSDRRYCNVIGCTARVILAERFPERVWRPYEANDVDPSTPGAHVLIANHAWRPTDYAEDLRVRHQLTEAAAREITEGYPFHLPHRHNPEERQQP